MKLEDAFLYVVFGNALTADALVEACREVIAAGGDVIQIAAGDGLAVSPGTAGQIADVCREEEALLVLRDNAELAVELNASGVHLSGGDLEMGLVRAMLGSDRLVGISSHTLDGARLSLEIGADYLLHHAGSTCAAEFAALKHEARVPLFAAGLTGGEDAAALVADDVFRLCIDGTRMETGELTEAVARCARMLGRCL